MPASARLTASGTAGSTTIVSPSNASSNYSNNHPPEAHPARMTGSSEHLMLYIHHGMLGEQPASDSMTLLRHLLAAEEHS
jgi:hypothetical protein